MVNASTQSYRSGSRVNERLPKVSAERQMMAEGQDCGRWTGSVRGSEHLDRLRRRQESIHNRHRAEGES